MYILKKFCLTLLCTSLFAVSAQASGTSSIVIDAKSGNILYSNNAEELRYPASLTKLMTLYITFNALESGKLKLTDKLKVSRTAASRSPSKLGAPAGSYIDVKTLIQALIVKSANDCATVLAEALSPTEAEFAELMTKTARKLGMHRTTFKNASGLPNSAQKTTAKDLAILGAAIYHHFPQYYPMFSLTEFQYKGTTYKTHNYLLHDSLGTDGMKTGYTAASGFNILTSAQQGNYRVIAVTLGHKKVKERDQDVSKMMELSLNHIRKNQRVNTNSLKSAINSSLKSTKTKTAYNHTSRKYRR
ncbi:MAG: D-alanyl-D-alanine carboxypeptidase [Alphaproteobacteria bacterium]|nr:D-alanyl-D-alanine carboxypeptidase [Alphaproteobacteria bacterium]